MKPLELGAGHVETKARPARLELARSPSGYSNAQLDDYGRSPRASLPWLPPVHVRVRARASLAEPIGTLGFGFWNDPFSIALGQRGATLQLPAPPEAVWFFYSCDHSSFRFTQGLPDHGWKAMCLTTPRLPGLLLAPAALIALLLGRIPLVRRPVMDLALGQVSASEVMVPFALDVWHTYEIDWLGDQIEFRVDNQQILRSTVAARGPLGFVTWIDNQYAVASRSQGLRFGTIAPHGPQALEIAGLSITRRRPDIANG